MNDSILAKSAIETEEGDRTVGRIEKMPRNQHLNCLDQAHCSEQASLACSSMQSDKSNAWCSDLEDAGTGFDDSTEAEFPSEGGLSSQSSSLESAEVEVVLSRKSALEVDKLDSKEGVGEADEQEGQEKLETKRLMSSLKLSRPLKSALKCRKDNGEESSIRLRASMKATVKFGEEWIARAELSKRQSGLSPTLPSLHTEIAQALQSMSQPPLQASMSLRQRLESGLSVLSAPVKPAITNEGPLAQEPVQSRRISVWDNGFSCCPRDLLEAQAAEGGGLALLGSTCLESGDEMSMPIFACVRPPRVSDQQSENPRQRGERSTSLSGTQLLLGPGVSGPRLAGGAGLLSASSEGTQTSLESGVTCPKQDSVCDQVGSVRPEVVVAAAVKTAIFSEQTLRSRSPSSKLQSPFGTSHPNAKESTGKSLLNRIQSIYERHSVSHGQIDLENEVGPSPRSIQTMKNSHLRNSINLGVQDFAPRGDIGNSLLILSQSTSLPQLTKDFLVEGSKKMTAPDASRNLLQLVTTRGTEDGANQTCLSVPLSNAKASPESKVTNEADSKSTVWQRCLLQVPKLRSGSIDKSKITAARDLGLSSMQSTVNGIKSSGNHAKRPSFSETGTFLNSKSNASLRLPDPNIAAVDLNRRPPPVPSRSLTPQDHASTSHDWRSAQLPLKIKEPLSSIPPPGPASLQARVVQRNSGVNAVRSRKSFEKEQTLQNQPVNVPSKQSDPNETATKLASKEFLPARNASFASHSNPSALPPMRVSLGGGCSPSSELVPSVGPFPDNGLGNLEPGAEDLRRAQSETNNFTATPTVNTSSSGNSIPPVTTPKLESKKCLTFDKALERQMATNSPANLPMSSLPSKSADGHQIPLQSLKIKNPLREKRVQGSRAGVVSFSGDMSIYSKPPKPIGGLARAKS